MRTLESWFAEYSESHQNPANQKIHQICVPAIFFSILLLLRSIPRAGWMESLPEWLSNWATLALVGPLVFYFLVSRRLFFLMLLQVGVMLWVSEALAGMRTGLGAVVFVLAWAGQFYGHKIEGRKPSFLKDLVFLLIGPLWVTRKWMGQ